MRPLIVDDIEGDLGEEATPEVVFKVDRDGRAGLDGVAREAAVRGEDVCLDGAVQSKGAGDDAVRHVLLPGEGDSGGGFDGGFGIADDFDDIPDVIDSVSQGGNAAPGTQCMKVPVVEYVPGVQYNTRLSVGGLEVVSEGEAVII